MKEVSSPWHQFQPVSLLSAPWPQPAQCQSTLHLEIPVGSKRHGVAGGGGGGGQNLKILEFKYIKCDNRAY